MKGRPLINFVKWPDGSVTPFNGKTGYVKVFVAPNIKEALREDKLWCGGENYASTGSSVPFNRYNWEVDRLTW